MKTFRFQFWIPYLTSKNGLLNHRNVCLGRKPYFASIHYTQYTYACYTGINVLNLLGLRMPIVKSNSVLRGKRTDISDV